MQSNKKSELNLGKLTLVHQPNESKISDAYQSECESKVECLVIGCGFGTYPRQYEYCLSH